MKTGKANVWWPNELAFALLFGITAIRLLLFGVRGGFFSAIFFVLLGVIYLGRTLSERIRLWLYPALMLTTYELLGFAVPIFHPASTMLLATADRWLFGRDASLFLEPWICDWATDLFFLLYLFFFVYIGLSFWSYNKCSSEVFSGFMIGLFTVYGVGFIGYTILPAGGPYLELAGDFSVPIKGSEVSKICDRIVRFGSNRIDCFPCLHFAVSLYILIFDWLYCRRRFWWMLLPCVGIWLATIYLRLHYLVDLFGGLLLVVFSLWLVRLMQKNRKLNQSMFDK